MFPSYYEPWGYTPMECVVRGIPAVTSDFSGFGAYVMNHFPDHDANGIYVARRQRIQLRNRVESYAEHFDWSNMSRYYRLARRMALEKYYPDHCRASIESEEQSESREREA